MPPAFRVRWSSRPLRCRSRDVDRAADPVAQPRPALVRVAGARQRRRTDARAARRARARSVRAAQADVVPGAGARARRAAAGSPGLPVCHVALVGRACGGWRAADARLPAMLSQTSGVLALVAHRARWRRCGAARVGHLLALVLRYAVAGVGSRAAGAGRPGGRRDAGCSRRVVDALLVGAAGDIDVVQPAAVGERRAALACIRGGRLRRAACAVCPGPEQGCCRRSGQT